MSYATKVKFTDEAMAESPPAKLQWINLKAPGIDVRLELPPETIKGLVEFTMKLAADAKRTP